MSLEFPLLDLFHKLHNAGLPLGIDEYKAFLRALQGGFGHDVESLKRICKALWVTSPDDEHLFDYQFSQIEDELRRRYEGVQEEIQEENIKEEKLLEEAESTESSIVPEKEQPTPDLSDIRALPMESPELMQLDDEAEGVQVVTALQGESQEMSMTALQQQFILSGNYFPITRRQMKQNWRYLRRFVREGVCDELDVEATVHEIGRNGFFLKPVMVPRRTNQVELVLLIDQGGSMVPFHALSERLKETALRGGRLKKASVYYFHNCPQEWLFHDPGMFEAVKIETVLSRMRPSYTHILLVSDGGAARGWFNPERIEVTGEFLYMLRLRVARIAWLNPMPRRRWFGATAGEIAQDIPMFEMSRQGLDKAISALRRQT